jgi:hypothetical protein
MTDQAMLGQAAYGRHGDDSYQTPAWVTQALVDTIDIPRGMVWEPASGDGVMARILSQSGRHVLTTDIRTGLDFLDVRPGAWVYDEVKAIITNPPFYLADKFIRHALGLMQSRGGMVGMLLRNEYDSAKKRADIFRESPHFCCKVVLTRRPRWIAGTSGSPRHNFAWFVWRCDNEGPPEIRWAG